MADNQTEQHIKTQMNFKGPVNAAAGTVEGDMVVNPKQSIADSAAEIQELLEFLNNSYGGDLPEDKQAEVEVAVKAIEKDPALRERLVSAFKAGGIEAVKEITDNPYVNILLAAYEGFKNPG